MAKGRVLIVEDDVGIASAIAAMLREERYEARWVDGEDAAATALSFKPDLVLLDILMEPVDGVMVAEQLRRRRTTEKIPIVVMTSLSDPSGYLPLIRPFGVLMKSQFSIEELLSLVSAALAAAA